MVQHSGIYLSGKREIARTKHGMREMLTESQFKVLIILFDDQGHAGWELAKNLEMKESNLNPYLKKLEERQFIIQGTPRKSTKPKRREGDYKEIPYYLNKDIQILETIIKEMVVTNKVYDTGFPLRTIKSSNYIKSMKKSDEDFNEFITKLFKEVHLNIARAALIWPHPTLICKVKIPPKGPLYELYILSFKEREPNQVKERRVTKKLLDDLELWWFKYKLQECFCQELNAIYDYDEFQEVLEDFTSGGDVEEMILEAINKLSNR